jgi:alpha-mannosidase
LYPHLGSWDEETQREAYLLNDPIIVYPSDRERRTEDRLSSTVHALRSLVSVSVPNIIIETIKRAEDGDGIIVRVYESQRKRGPVQIRFGRAVQAAWMTNLLEENASNLKVDQDSIQTYFRPYQIVTMRVKFK